MSLLAPARPSSLPEMARETAEQDVALRHQRCASGSARASPGSRCSPPAMVVLRLRRRAHHPDPKTGQFDQDPTRRVAEGPDYGFALLANAAVRLFATTFAPAKRLPASYAAAVVASTPSLCC